MAPAATPAGRDDGGTELPRRRVLAIFAGLVMSILVAAMNGTTVATALPTIAGELDGLGRISWLITAYLLGQTVAMPLGGKLGDLFGRKRILHTALLVFLAGSLLAGFAQSMNALIAFRALQGVGSGALIVTAQGIIGDVVPARRRGRYLSLIAPMVGVGIVGGPLLGGFFIDHLSWRWIFHVNLPLVLVVLAVTAITVKLPRSSRRPRIDYAGALSLGGAVTCVVLVTSWGGARYPWNSAPIIALLGAVVALGTMWLAAERRAEEPILPLELFRNRIFVVSVSLGFGVGIALFGAVGYLPTFLQVVSGASATGSGLVLVPLVGGMIGASVLTGQLMSYTGRYKLFPILGTAICTAGMLLLSTMDAGTARLVINLDMAVVGVGIGFVMPVLTTVVQNSVHPRHLGTATSGINFFRQIGGSVGTALAGTLLTTRMQDQLLARVAPGQAEQALQRVDSITPQTLAQLPPELHRAFVAAVGNALPSVYLDFAPILFVAFVIAWFMRERPLETRLPAP